MFCLPKLPYATTALEPFLSSETFMYHYGKHHKGYIDHTNSLIQDTKFENATLEEIVFSSSGALFSNASQAWNHTFYWYCMRPVSEGGNFFEPTVDLIAGIEKAYGSITHLKEVFVETALGLLGSGWVWLVADHNRKLQLISLPNADSPLRLGLMPILVCDVWEHSYYVDYRNNRRKYVEGFLATVDWSFVCQNFKSEEVPNMTRLMTPEHVLPQSNPRAREFFMDPR
jgi:Fe-Mn family superoxide dismutase